jgi:hypothetical protein
MIRFAGTAGALVVVMGAQIFMPSMAVAYQRSAETVTVAGSCAVPLTSAGFALYDAAGQGGTIGEAGGAGGFRNFEGYIYLLEGARHSFTLRHTAYGNENWISIPVKGSGVTDTFSLGRSIASGFAAEPGDSVRIETWDNAAKIPGTTSGGLVDGGSGPQWVWADNQPIAAGMMLKVFLLRSAGPPEFSLAWSIEGVDPELSETVFRISRSVGGNENRIMVPPSMSWIADTVALGRSITSTFAAEPGDSILIETWDNASQTSQITSGDFVPADGGGEWLWDNTRPLRTAEPVIVHLSHQTDGPAFEIIWP